MPTTTTTRGDRTRSAVLSAAAGRFAADGYDGATVASIAADAGVSEPTVAFHFGSKSGLLVAVLRDWYAELLRLLEDVVDEADDPQARLRSFARWWLAHSAEHHLLLAVFGRQGRRAEVDEVVEAFREENRRVTRVFDRLVADLRHVGALRPDVPTRIVRDAFFGTTEHVLLGWATTGRPTDLKRAADDLVALLFHGVGVEAAPVSGPSQLTAIEQRLDEVLTRLDRLDRS